MILRQDNVPLPNSTVQKTQEFSLIPYSESYQPRYKNYGLDLSRFRGLIYLNEQIRYCIRSENPVAMQHKKRLIMDLEKLVAHQSYEEALEEGMESLYFALKIDPGSFRSVRSGIFLYNLLYRCFPEAHISKYWKEIYSHKVMIKARQIFNASPEIKARKAAQRAKYAKKMRQEKNAAFLEKDRIAHRCGYKKFLEAASTSERDVRRERIKLAVRKSRRGKAKKAKEMQQIYALLEES